MSTDRNASRRRHPSAARPLWTSIELSAPVEAIRMLELAELLALTFPLDTEGGYMTQ